MIKIAIRLLGLGVIISSTACGTIPVEKYQTKTSEGKAVLTYYFNSWDQFCATKETNIRVIEKPSNGTLSFKRAERKIGAGAKIGTNQSCAGRSVMAKEMYYTPNKNFEGDDDFLVESTITGVAGATRAKVTIEVR